MKHVEYLWVLKRLIAENRDEASRQAAVEHGLRTLQHVHHVVSRIGSYDPKRCKNWTDQYRRPREDFPVNASDLLTLRRKVATAIERFNAVSVREREY